MVTKVSTRKPALASVLDPDFADIPEERQEPEEPREPRDPAVLAASRMLADALDRPSVAAEAVDRVGAVVVIRSPNLEWSPFLLRAFPDVAGGAWSKMRLTYIPSSARPDRWSDRSDKPSWALRTKHGDKLDEKEIIEAVWLGCSVVVATDDLGWLPQAVKDATDIVLTVEAPGAGALLAASGVCADGPDEWPHGAPVGVTPGMVRSAFRNGAAVSECHQRMARLLDGVAPSVTTSKQVSPWTLETLHGMPEVTGWGRRLAKDVAAWRADAIGWQDLDGGAMLVGPPGCGKTTVARAIAEAAGLRFLPTSYGELESGKSGADWQVTRRMKEFFDGAKSEPSLVLLDEIDAIPARNGAAHNSGWFNVIVTSLLAILDGAVDRGHVVVVGAANSIEGLDPALLRPGRLDRVLRVPLPDRAALEEIVLEHVPELSLMDARVVARRMAGKTGADVSQVARDARRLARSAGRPVAVGDLLAGLVADVRSAWERRVSAFHEAGHAVACEALRPGAVVSASVADDEHTGGGVGMLAWPTTQPLECVELRCVIALSGRAAEDVILGQVSSGAGGSARSDLARVTAEIVRARTALGLCGELAWRGEVDVERAGVLVSLRSDIARWAEERVQELYARALDIVGCRQPEVEALAEALLERESLDGEEVRAVLEAARTACGGSSAVRAGRS